jgi:hypothetical protein
MAFFGHLSQIIWVLAIVNQGLCQSGIYPFRVVKLKNDFLKLKLCKRKSNWPIVQAKDSFNILKIKFHGITCHKIPILF